jgi:hypothetical protein
MILLVELIYHLPGGGYYIHSTRGIGMAAQ